MLDSTSFKVRIHLRQDVSIVLNPSIEIVVGFVNALPCWDVKFWQLQNGQSLTATTNRKMTFIFVMCNAYNSLNPTN